GRGVRSRGAGRREEVAARRKEGWSMTMSEEPTIHDLDEAVVKGPPKTMLAGVLKAVRPRQWVKNVLVLAAPMAAGSISNGSILYHVGIAFVAFCLAASSIYLINDALDVEADRAHPTKRFRPIAAGVLPVNVAYTIAAVLMLGSLLVSVAATWRLA